MGSSRVPEIFDPRIAGKALLVPEIHGIQMCRLVAKRYGILIGGSTGSVLAGVVQAYGNRDCPKKIVVISPDSGERYLDTIYNDSWVKHRFPEFEPRAFATSDDHDLLLSHSGTPR